MNFQLQSSIAAALCAAGFLNIGAASAAELPLWELGMGVATMSVPDYRGSDERTTYLLPAPYIVYRGEFLKADRNGIRGLLLDSEKYELSFSVSGTLPVNSKDNGARRGMSSLKPTVELGANLSVNLWKSQSDRLKLDLRTPLRSAITVESSPKNLGWIFSPNINLDVRDPFGHSGWNFGMLAGPLFQSQRYNSYFYSVSAADATATRPIYSAGGGYSGSQFTMALSKRFPSYWVGGFLRYDTLAGSKFENSPLVRQKSNVSAGAAISWVFGRSKKMVEAAE